MANKELYTVDQLKGALQASGGIHLGAAQKLGCSPNAVKGYIVRHPELAAFVDELKDVKLDLAETHLLQALNSGAPWAIKFYLQCQGKHRGWTERHEVTGKNGAPIETQAAVPDYSALSVEELEQLEALHVKAAHGKGS